MHTHRPFLRGISATERRRWRGKASQVCVFGVTCDANLPQEKKSVAGPANFADLRRKRLGPATPKGWTRDAKGQNPRH